MEYYPLQNDANKQAQAPIPNPPLQQMNNGTPKMGHVMPQPPVMQVSPYDTSAQRITDDKFNYNYDPFTYNYIDILKRAIKYLVEGCVVAFVAHTFTKGKLEMNEILMIGITASFVFAMLDTFSPTISLGARLGTGLTLGPSIFGLAPLALL